MTLLNFVCFSHFFVMINGNVSDIFSKEMGRQFLLSLFDWLMDF